MLRVALAVSIVFPSGWGDVVMKQRVQMMTVVRHLVRLLLRALTGIPLMKSMILVLFLVLVQVMC